METASVPDAPPAEALELNESVSLVLEEAESLPEDFFTPAEPGSIFDAKGRVPIVVIRPGIGKGRGRHLYEADMLRKNADVFSGWRMFVDHQSPEARKAAGGLPRSVRDLGGRIEESRWWDGLPADAQAGHGQGGVIGLAKPVPFIRELVENDPEIIESSISANATGVRQVTRDGQRVWLVEGIEDHGSVDWVTEAGAGGRVIPLMEAAYDSEEKVDKALLESMSDDEFTNYLQESRPDLIEAMKGDAEGPGDCDSDEHAEKTAQLMKKGLPREAAKKAARKALQETNDEGEADVPDITKEALQEALSSSPELFVKALQESSEVQLFVSGLVEAKLDEEREVIETQADERVDRAIQIRDFQTSAHDQIRESKLPETWQDGLRDRYSLVEGKASPALDVLDDVDEDGNVTKSAADKLAEAVEEDIKSERKRLAEARPTRVRGQGAPDETDDSGTTKVMSSAKKTGWGEWLQESAGVDPDKAFALKGDDKGE